MQYFKKRAEGIMPCLWCGRAPMAMYDPCIGGRVYCDNQWCSTTPATKWCNTFTEARKIWEKSAFSLEAQTCKLDIEK